MRDYLTLSWARFSKDVQSHTLQISKILSHPAPRPGETVRLDASSAPHHGGHASETSLEVVSRFPGGLDFRDGLVDVNFTMWPLFKCLNIDNILTICEVSSSNRGPGQELIYVFLDRAVTYRPYFVFFETPCDA